MVKQADPVSGTSGGDSNKPQVMIGGTSGLSVILHRLRTRRLIVLIAVVIVATVGFFYWNSHRIVITPVPGAKQARAEQVAQLRDAAPSSKASTGTQAQYYDSLSVAEANAGHYQAAIDAFNKSAQLQPNSLSYGDYFYLAQYYQKVGNKQAALDALVTAAKLVPPDNNQTGFSHDDVEANIAALRQEISG